MSAALEQGTPPWVRPWYTLPEAIPMNAQSRRPYRGVNFALLSLEAAAHGCHCCPGRRHPPLAVTTEPIVRIMIFTSNHSDQFST